MKTSVVKSTIQLSRNMDLYPFPAGLTFDASAEVEAEIIRKIEDIENDVTVHSLVGMQEDAKEQLYHEGLITYLMVRNTIHSSAIVTSSNRQYRINGDDHLEMVVTSYNENLLELWNDLLAVEQQLAPKLNFAFDLKLGYLTSRITEIGTGLKISVVLHLPGIVRTGYVKKLIQAVHQVGFSLKEYTLGLKDEAHHYYELSNSVTIGKSEVELIEGMKELIERIEKKESDALETLRSAQDKVLEDELFRAYGIIQNARLISYEEGIELLSKVRLGVALGLIDTTTVDAIDPLIFMIQPHLIEGRQLPIGRKGEGIRAEYLRMHFK